METDRHLSKTLPGKRPPAYAMRALGRGNLPEALALNGVTWRHVRTHKHDFWAVTGFYENDRGEMAVLKISRTEPLAGFDMEWIGRWLCRRELRFYQKMSDVPNVPSVLGRVGRTGFLHAYAPGAPLSRDRCIPDGFFTRLRELVEEMHRRGLAYVDANKPENILMDDEGNPYLIDFQISWDLAELGNSFLNRWWLRKLQRADIYHILKHKRRLRPDEMSAEEEILAEKRGIVIRIHRVLAAPYKRIRRSTFKRMRESGRLLPEGSK